MDKFIFMGAPDALAERQALLEIAKSVGIGVAKRMINPASMDGGIVARFFGRIALRRLASGGGDDVLVLVERDGDKGWKPWMVYAIGAGLRQIAVPARLKGQDNIGGARSGVATYTKLETVDDLKEIERATLWEVQKASQVK